MRVSDELLKVDSSNYYNYCSDGTGKKGNITTAWLKDYEIIPILLEENSNGDSANFELCSFQPTDKNKNIRTDR